MPRNYPPGNTVPERALTGSTIAAYQIAMLLLSVENSTTILRAINEPFKELELRVVVSARFIESVLEDGRICCLRCAFGARRSWSCFLFESNPSLIIKIDI